MTRRVNFCELRELLTHSLSGLGSQEATQTWHYSSFHETWTSKSDVICGTTVPSKGRNERRTLLKSLACRRILTRTDPNTRKRRTTEPCLALEIPTSSKITMSRAEHFFLGISRKCGGHHETSVQSSTLL